MTQSDHPFLESIGHVCTCLHTLGTHSPKTGACLVCPCLKFEAIPPTKAAEEVEG